MAQRNTQRQPTDEITVGFKTAQRYAAWVHAAAARRQMSASKYLEKLVLELSAAEIGVHAEEVREALTPRPPTREIVEQAAKIAGVSPREFARRAAAEAARAVLAPSNAAPPKRASGTHRRVG